MANETGNDSRFSDEEVEQLIEKLLLRGDAEPGRGGALMRETAKAVAELQAELKRLRDEGRLG